MHSLSNYSFFNTGFYYPQIDTRLYFVSQVLFAINLLIYYVLLHAQFCTSLYTGMSIPMTSVKLVYCVGLIGSYPSTEKHAAVFTKIICGISIKNQRERGKSREIHLAVT